jgi:regulator of ribosome biosynthesis
VFTTIIVSCNINMYFSTNLEEYLQSTARDGIQCLFSALFTLPTQASPDGPLAKLPPPVTQLPRSKPLPKPKPPTKWERFAAAKGIQHKKRDRREWDEEKQEWVNRWGRDGKNKQKEEQWITEVPANAGEWFDRMIIVFRGIHFSLSSQMWNTIL